MSIHGHVDSAEALGSRLKHARQDAGLSQRDLAFPGCTAVYVCRIERGDRVPSLQVLRELARRLEVGEEWLAFGTGDPMPPLVLTLNGAVLDTCLRRVTQDKQETGLADLTDQERERLVRHLVEDAEVSAVHVAVAILSDRPAL